MKAPRRIRRARLRQRLLDLLAVACFACVALYATFIAVNTPMRFIP